MLIRRIIRKNVRYVYQQPMAKPAFSNVLVKSPNFDYLLNDWQFFDNFLTTALLDTFLMFLKLSFYSTLQTTAECLFTFQFPLTFHNNNTCNYSICKRRFEKGIFCWNILSSCICTIVDVFLSYIVTAKNKDWSFSPTSQLNTYGLAMFLQGVTVAKR